MIFAHPAVASQILTVRQGINIAERPAGSDGSVEHQQVAHLLFLGHKIPESWLLGLDLEWNPLDDIEAGVTKGLQLLGIIRHQADPARAKLANHLCALVIFALVDIEAESKVGLDRIGTLVLKRVGTDFINDTDSTAFLMLVDDNSLPLFLDHLHGALKLRAAIAFE